jgi:serine protease
MHCVTLCGGKKNIRLFGLALSMLAVNLAGVLPAGAGAKEPKPALQPYCDTNSIVVRFKDKVNQQERAAVAAALGGAIKQESRFTPGLCTIALPPGADPQQVIAQYQQRADVVYAEPNHIDVPFEAPAFTPDDPLYYQQWHFQQIRLPQAWDIVPSRGVSNVIVAIVDTGIAYENYDYYQQAPDLAGVNFVFPYDAVDYDGHPCDDNGHGTHVCGTIAQATHNALGVAGMADHISIMPVRSLGPGGGTHSQFSDAIHWAVDHGAKIINYSGGGSDSTTKHDAVIYAYNNGVLLIAAYGNTSSSNPASAYPARYAEALGVGAVDRNKALAYYSNWGDGMDVVAPGGDTSVSETNGVLQNTFETTVTNFDYHGYQGTSMATPHVSGLAALLWSQGIFTNRQAVFDRIIQTCEDLGAAGYDATFGWGLIDAAAALSATLAAPGGVSAGDGDYPDKVQVSWNQTPGATGYIIYRGTNSATNLAQAIGQAVTAPYDDSAAAGNAIYFYWVQATNAAGGGAWSDPDSGYRSGVPPTITLQPANQAVNPGDCAAFSVAATGDVPLFYQWQKDGAMLAAATAATFTISAAASGDAGNYRCLASNLFGAATSAPAALTINAPVPTLPAPIGVAASDGLYTNKVQVAWQAAAGATSYEVWRHTAANSAAAAKIGGTTDTAFDDVSAASYGNTSLYYWVKSRNAAGVSVFSAADVGYCALSSNAASGAADLALNSLLFLPAALEVGGHPTLLAAVLVNNGPDALAAPNRRVVLDFYLATNAVLDQGSHLWLGEYAGDIALSAGSHTTLILSAADLAAITIPAGAGGQYYVLARARHAAPSTLLDPNMSNNVAVRSGLIAVGAAAVVRTAVAGDFDGDGKADPALFEEASGKWQVKLSASAYASATLDGFGAAGYLPICGDYDGDRKTDPTLFDAATGTLYARLSASGYAEASATFSGYGYCLVSADYDGGGQADLALYQEASASWIVLLTESLTLAGLVFGEEGCRPVAGDFDGDRKADPALYQEASGEWFVELSAGGYGLAGTVFGGPGQQPVPGDYDGDNRTDLMLYEPASGKWQVKLSASGYAIAALEGFGGPDCAPVCGDYDGDGKADLALYQATTQTWFFRLSASAYALITYPF